MGWDGSACILINTFTHGDPYDVSLVKVDAQGNILANAGLAAIFASSGAIDVLAFADLAIDAAGNVLLTGDAGAVSSPGHLTGDDSSCVVKLRADLGKILWSIGGFGGEHIALDANGDIYVPRALSAGRLTSARSASPP